MDIDKAQTSILTPGELSEQNKTPGLKFLKEIPDRVSVKVGF